MYEYMTEGVYLEEKMLGRTSVASADVIKTIGDKFNARAAQGWELYQVCEVDVVGKVFKSSEHRTVTVAIWRRTRT